MIKRKSIYLKGINKLKVEKEIEQIENDKIVVKVKSCGICSSDLKFINRATKGVYEFGSVFKSFTIAAGLNYDVINPSTEFKDLKKRILCAGNLISEYDNKIPSNLTAEEILIRSGNIGSVRIAEKIGIEN